MRRLRAFMVCWALPLLLPCCGAAATEDDSLEYPVKAAFLSKFGEFVTWPDSAFASPDSPVSVCVMGSDPFGSHLDRIAETQTIGRRRVNVRRLAWSDAALDCHILYVSAEREQPIRDTLDSLQGQPVLTVTDTASAGDVRGIVHFAIRDNRVRFHIDSGAAAGNGLSISSKLLGLALTVTQRG